MVLGIEWGSGVNAGKIPAAIDEQAFFVHAINA
jgi:hypothetical protein